MSPGASLGCSLKKPNNFWKCTYFGGYCRFIFEIEREKICKKRKTLDSAVCIVFLPIQRLLYEFLKNKSQIDLPHMASNQTRSE
jgi:hypothetical protein